jgi:hypothetical protein
MHVEGERKRIAQPGLRGESFKPGLIQLGVDLRVRKLESLEELEPHARIAQVMAPVDRARSILTLALPLELIAFDGGKLVRFKIELALTVSM